MRSFLVVMKRVYREEHRIPSTGIRSRKSRYLFGVLHLRWLELRFTEPSNCFCFSMKTLLNGVSLAQIDVEREKW